MKMEMLFARSRFGFGSALGVFMLFAGGTASAEIIVLDVVMDQGQGDMACHQLCKSLFSSIAQLNDKRIRINNHTDLMPTNFFRGVKEGFCGPIIHSRTRIAHMDFRFSNKLGKSFLIETVES